MTEAVRVGWLLLLLIVMLAHRRLRNESVAEREPGTWFGIFTQAVGFSVIWTLHRGDGSLPPAAVVLVTWIANACGLAAVVIGVAAIWTLGRQWSVDGRLIPEHRLVAAGISVFVAGTVIRVHYEEKLLSKRFGVAFQQYAATVPAFLPWIGPGGTRRSRGLPEPSRGIAARADEAGEA
jgi:protein-S-isoprenylcysteine O-methyltransferase Ste14